MGFDAATHTSFTIKKLFLECIPHLTVVLLYLIIAKSSGRLSPVFPLLLVGLGILSLCVVGWKALSKKRTEKSLKYSYGRDDFAMECSCAIALFLMFAIFFQDLHHQYDDLFIVEEGTTYLNWLLFTLENIFESIFDILSIYEIKISGIQPTDTIAKSAVLFFRFTVNVVVLMLIVRNWRNLKAYWQVRKKRTI